MGQYKLAQLLSKCVNYINVSKFIQTDSRASRVTLPSILMDAEEAEYVAGHVDGDTIVANLGFLQLDNTYRALIHTGSLLGKDVVEAQKNPHVSLLEQTPNVEKGVHELVVEIVVKQDAHLSEELIIMNKDKKIFKLYLLAQVLDSNQGRATLKRGVHCTRHVHKEFDPSKKNLES